MKSKLRILTALGLAAFMVTALVTAVDAHNGRIVKAGVGTPSGINDDSSNTTSFTLRKSGDVGADKDTSDIYDMVNIDHIVLVVKGSPKLDGVTRAVATALDSGAAIVRTQGSNGSMGGAWYWKDIDTTTAADSLASSEELWFKERTYRYLRWIVETTTKSDDSGVTVILRPNFINR